MSYEPGPTIPPMISSITMQNICGKCGVLYDDSHACSKPFKSPEQRIEDLEIQIEGKDAVIEAQRLIIEEMRNQPTAGHRRETLNFIPGQIGYGFNYDLGPMIP